MTKQCVGQTSLHWIDHESGNMENFFTFSSGMSVASGLRPRRASSAHPRGASSSRVSHRVIGCGAVNVCAAYPHGGAARQCQQAILAVTKRRRCAVHPLLR
jgi:hypothetical protein